MIDPSQAPPGATQLQGEEAAGAVCIAPQGDGSFSVYLDDQPDGGKTAPDVDAALQMAKQMLGGQESAPDDAEALFQGGFQGARGQLNKG